MDYTVEVHANRMPKFLECKDLTKKCPASLGFSLDEELNVFGGTSECPVCVEFVGLPAHTEKCPCNVLGHSEAIAAAHHALALWDAGEHPMQEKRE